MTGSTDRAAARRRATARLTGFDQVGALLWPDSAGPPSQTRSRDGMLIVPSARKPRLAVPAGRPKVAARVALRHGDTGGTAARTRRTVLAALLRSPARRLVFRERGGATGDSPLLAHLAAVLGQPVVASFPITPARANRKPVLQLTDEHGEPVAFAKIGVDEITRALVRHEAAALEAVARADLQHITTPRVLDAHDWQGHAVLVMSALPVWDGTTAPDEQIGSAMREFAEQVHRRESTGACVDVLHTRAVGAFETADDADDRATSAALIEFLDRHRATLTDVPRGAWHGDWTPWNCRRHGNRLLVWDLERVERDVPLGFDAVHFAMQRAVTRGTSHVDAAAAIMRDAVPVLRGWQMSDAQKHAVVALYLVAISLRYLHDGQRAVGGAGGDVGRWSVPALRTFATDVDDDSGVNPTGPARGRGTR